MKEHLVQPTTASELDELIHKIDMGDGYFASLSDEQRDQLKAELSEEWLTEYLSQYPISANLHEAGQEYREIESKRRYPNLPDNVSNDILMHFNEHYGEGGPDRWDARPLTERER